jgi:integrase
MEHQAIKFTDERIRKLKPAPGQRECTKYDTDVHKLFVRATQNGKRTFYVRLGSKKVRIGRHPTLNVEQARQKAKDLIHRYDHGEDVAAEYRTRRQHQAASGRGEIITFESVVEAFIAANPNGAQSAHLDKTRRTLKLHFAPIYGQPFATLKADAYQGCLSAIRGRQGAAPYASGRINAVLNWAADEYRIPNVLGSKRERKRLPKMPRARKVFLPGETMPKVFQTARDGLPSPVGELLQFLIYTPVRSHEAAAARWSELNEARTVWTIPASPGRMKGGEAAEPLVVPLPPQVTALLRKIKRHAGSDYVFTYTGRRPMSGFGRYKSDFDKALAAAGVELPKWRLHDLRRTFNMWAMSRAKDFAFSVKDVADRCLGHVVHRGVQGVYNLFEYIDERRELLAAWADHLTELGPGEVRPEILPPAVPVAQPMEWNWTVDVGGKGVSSTTLVPARPPLAYLHIEQPPTALVELTEAYYMVRAIYCDREATNEVDRVWELKELDYNRSFFEAHGSDPEKVAMAAIQRLIDLAMKEALGGRSVVTSKAVEDACAHLETMIAKWQSWADGNGPPGADTAIAAQMVEKYTRDLADLPKEGGLLLVDRSRGDLGSRQPIGQGVQRILLDETGRIFAVPRGSLATAIARAVTGADLSRFHLRGLKVG